MLLPQFLDVGPQRLTEEIWREVFAVNALGVQTPLQVQIFKHALGLPCFQLLLQSGTAFTALEVLLDQGEP